MSRDQSQNHVSHFLNSNFGLQYQCKEPGADLATVPDYYDTDKETENWCSDNFEEDSENKTDGGGVWWIDDALSTRNMISSFEISLKRSPR